MPTIEIGYLTEMDVTWRDIKEPRLFETNIPFDEVYFKHMAMEAAERYDQIVKDDDRVVGYWMDLYYGKDKLGRFYIRKEAIWHYDAEPIKEDKDVVA